MITPERKAFNKAVRELDELHFQFETNLEKAIVTLLKKLPNKRIDFSNHIPQLVMQTIGKNITLATISAIWLKKGAITAQLNWKDGNTIFCEESDLSSMNFCDLYHTYTTLTEAIKKTLKDQEDAEQEPTTQSQSETQIETQPDTAIVAEEPIPQQDCQPTAPEIVEPAPSTPKPNSCNNQVLKVNIEIENKQSRGFLSKLFGK